jgi:hypothetical protein
MDLPSKDIMSIVLGLMPGFLAAWVFYGLTAHPKKTPFERVVQALIFTAIIQSITFCIREFLFLVGRDWRVLGEWNADVALIWSLLIAVVFGFSVAALANNNTIHLFLWKRRWNFKKRPDNEPIEGWVWTKRTAYPNEWYNAFNSENRRFLVLELKDGKRLYGWAEEWPDQPDSGHFVMTDAEWLQGDGESVKLDSVSRILIAASDVLRVEFVKFVDEREPRIE